LTLNRHVFCGGFLSSNDALIGYARQMKKQFPVVQYAQMTDCL